MITAGVNIAQAYDFDRFMTQVLGDDPFESPTFEPLPVVPLAKPLEEATIGLLVTCGAYFPDQPRPLPVNDLSYRLLPRERELDEILIGHKTPIRAFAEADPNCAYPRDALIALERDGSIGALASHAISMVGAIRRYEELATDVAPRLVAEYRSMAVDLVLVVPFCPQCHVASGVLSRAIETRGVPTTSLTTLLRAVLGLKPPRASFLDFPLGCPGGRPFERVEQQQIIHAALLAAWESRDTWELVRLPYRFDPDGGRAWERLVDDLYRVDHEIRGTVQERVKNQKSTSLVGVEGAFATRCAC
jgi:D-proline reductase (dithiol) PrdB